MAGTELGNAYVQIVPSAKGIKGSISKSLNGEASSAGEGAGLKIASLVKKTIAAAGIGIAFKKSLDAGGELEQSIGGIETLFGAGGQSIQEYAKQMGKSVSDVRGEYNKLQEAQNIALDNAKNAYKTAGLSANDYMQNVTSFAASLKQSLGGDTVKAAKAADTAMIDMADNANKMGTDITSIQNAYQGFAKQNYTMLDNLKLGYGGTKTEMEKLLENAGKLSGVEYNIDNLADVYDAIHVIQGDLGITGTTAREAASTMEGSFSSMKAAAENLMGNLALGQNVEQSMTDLVTTASTFFFGNALPMIGTIVKSIPSAVGAFIKTGVPQIAESGKELINGIITGAQEKIPEMVAKAGEMIPQILSTVGSKGPELMAKGGELISKLGEGISSKGPELLAKGGELVVNLANGVWENIPSLLQKGSEMISGLVSYVVDNLPKFAEKGGEILKNLASGFVSNIPSMVVAAAKMGLSLIQNINKLGGSLISAGVTLVANLVKGLGGSALSLVSSAAGKIKETLLKPIEAGKEKIRDIVDKIKNFFHFKISFPHVPLPHFSISPSGWKIGDLLKGSIPSLGIKWNAKAMDQPQVFKGATLFGAGETGDEILYGKRSLLSDIREASGDGQKVINNYFDITVDGSENPEDFADRLVRRLKMDMRTA